MSGKIILILAIGLIVLAIVFLPLILTRLGLHPHHEKKSYKFSGKRAIIITTSHNTLGDAGKPTGVYSSEMTIPYYEFLDAGMDVELASIQGGEIPIDPMGRTWPLATKADKQLAHDVAFQQKVQNSKKIEELDIALYDIIFIAGGWGAAYDLGQSVLLGEIMTQAASQNILIGSVCHGALGLINIKDEKGDFLLKGRNVTGVTNKQLKELGIKQTPMHPETELKRIGAIFHSNERFKDLFATKVVVDGNFVTGQNQNSGGETAQKLLALLAAK